MNKQTILRIAKYISIGFLTVFIAAVVLGGGLFLYYVSKAPSLSESKLVATTSSKIYDSKDELIADLGAERRVNAQSNEIPTELVNAITSIEDHRFFNHRGVDTIRILGAALRNLRGGGGLQGASTLTQQLIKLTYFSTSTADQTLSRKAQEAWLAVQLEQKATKQEILTYYINKVYMSNGNYGMQTAAQNYYGKDLKDLNLPQLALLAGMPQAPNQYRMYCVARCHYWIFRFGLRKILPVTLVQMSARKKKMWDVLSIRSTILLTVTACRLRCILPIP